MSFAFSTRRLVFAAAACIGVALAVALSLGLIHSRGEPDNDEIVAPQRVSGHGDQTLITLDPSSEHASDIHTAQLRASAQQPSIVAYGSVLELQSLLADAGASDAAYAQLEAAEAKSRESDLSLKRARSLQGDQNVSRAQLQAAEAAYEVDQSSLRVARTQLKFAEARLLQNWGPVLSRWIRERDSRFDRLIDAHDVLLWATLPIGERWREPVDAAVAIAENGRSVPLTFVSPALRSDPRLQGPAYFFTAPADSGLLPGMNVTVRAASGESTQMSLVPRPAVVWAEGRPWAYERVGSRQFRRLALDPLSQTAAGDFLLRAAPEQREFVVRGAQMLLSEEFRGAIDVND